MLKLKLTKREQIDMITPSGKVSIYLFGDGWVGIDAPKRWPINRIDLPTISQPGTVTAMRHSGDAGAPPPLQGDLSGTASDVKASGA